MNRIVILCIEDEPEVREAILRDLAPFRTAFRIESAEDAEDARAVMRETAARGEQIGLLLCDHLLPGQRGVDLLIDAQHDAYTARSRKVLITGQAGLEDTIRAVNQAGLHHYIAKPWQAQDLQEVVRAQLTAFVLDAETDPLPYVSVLDGARLLEAVAKRTSDR